MFSENISLPAKKEFKENTLIENSFTFLKKRCEEELKQEKDNGITEKMVEMNIEHTKRVLNFARQIYNDEKEKKHIITEDQERFLINLEIAAILHDVCKLNSKKPGGIDTFEHHISGAETAEEFLKGQIKENDIQQIKSAILHHSYIPFILQGIKKNGSIKLEPPKTLLEKILRDADILDLASIDGLKKIIETRQNPDSEFYKEDEGVLKNAINSALKSINEIKPYLYTEAAQKIFAINKREALKYAQKLLSV